MVLNESIVLRYRSNGHVRFQLPKDALSAAWADSIGAELLRLTGVYRVDWFLRQGKLAIRFNENLCDFAVLVRHLHGVIRNTPPRANPAARDLQPQDGASGPIGDWVSARGEDMRETFIALRWIARSAWRAGSGAMASRPAWLKEFMTDLVMLYLIKLHWPNITQLWLPNPWRYRYEWAATFYLIYLLMESRLPKR